MNQKLRISVFGRVSLSFEGRESSVFATTRERDLLALLALHRGNPLDRDELIAVLWPDDRSPNDRNRLSVVLYQLRRHIRDLGVNPNEAVVADRSAVWLDDLVVECDLWDFLDVWETEGADGAERLLALYRGPLNDGRAIAWASLWRSRTDAIYADVVKARALHHLRTGDFDLAESVMAEATLRSRGGAEVLRVATSVYHQAGNGARAIEAARSLLRQYRAANLEPDKETRAMVAEVRERYGRKSPAGREAMETLTAVLVDHAYAEDLRSACLELGIDMTEQRDYVLVRNPLVANDVARLFMAKAKSGRVLLQSVLMYPDESLSQQVRHKCREIPEGTVWASKGVAALLEEHAPSFVREAVALKERYRILSD